MPDKELFALAAAGRLTERKVIATQVKRMLRDRKIKALTNNFAMQWLQLKSLASASPDKERFAEFYPRSTAMQETMAGWMLIEPLLLFETVLIEDRSIYDFVAADYAYLNPRLMQWYGIAGERSKGYRRVKLPDGTRGGVITTAAVLTNTSLPLRTSPVSRGAWVAEVLFNRPPPPPPAEVPSIDEDDQEILKKGLTLRKQFEEHRKTSVAQLATIESTRLGSPWKTTMPLDDGAAITARTYLLTLQERSGENTNSTIPPNSKPRCSGTSRDSYEDLLSTYYLTRLEEG